MSLARIAADGSLRHSVAVMIVFGLLYSLLSFLLYRSGHQPSLPILIAVSPHKFYLAEAISLLPLTLQLQVLFSALCHLLSGSKDGNFKQTLAVLGFSNAIPNVVLFWIPDSVSYLAFGRMLDSVLPFYGVAWFVWLIVLSAMGLKVTEHISMRKAVGVALASFLIHGLIGMVFIRQC